MGYKNTVRRLHYDIKYPAMLGVRFTLLFALRPPSCSDHMMTVAMVPILEQKVVNESEKKQIGR